MKSFETFIKESVIDIPRTNLDPKVFLFPDDGGKPYLASSIKKQILMVIDEISQIIPIKKYYIVGSILTKLYSENSDIDVNIELFENDVDDVMQSRLLIILQRVNGQLAIGTTHPINYYIHLETPNEDRYDAIYDIQSDKWIKEPVNLDVNISEYIQNFQKIVSKIDITLAQLRRDIIDYEALAKLSNADIKNLKTMMERKLFEITEKIEILSDIRQAIVQKRQRAFKKPLTPQELNQYKSKNTLPEVIIDKMLQRYYYWDFIKKLEKILQDKEQLDDKDIQSIKKIDRDACLKTFENYIQNETFITEKIRKIKLQKIDWSNPRSRSHLQKVYRGMDRQTLRQVPQTRQPDQSKTHRLTATNIGSAQKITDIAKKAPSGIWRITPSQVKWIAYKYHFIPPNAEKNIKHLGNTGIMVWRKAKNHYYLVKQPARYFY